MTQPGGFPQPADGSAAPLIRLTFDGVGLRAVAGQTVAAALMAAGRRAWRLTSRRGEPRGLFCGMGVCYDCLVRVDGRPNVRACLAPVAEGMRVETQHGAGAWEVPG
jgi:predicted molibdopterin-dependent oxidoreductase YjgC